jgi:hypothetical protein
MKKRVVCLFFSDSAVVESFAEACLELTPDVSVRKGEAVFLEISRCQRLFDEKMLIEKLRALAARLSCKPRMAVADDVPTALALARRAVARHGGSKYDLPLEALRDYVAPFQIWSRCCLS